uniref:HTH_48 domain-containing protein n=1 Tax=Strongyloides papillosus TaxID=174720 RepID=A0A0N5BIQ3_STREA
MLSKRDICAIMLYEFKHGTNAAKTTQQIKETLGENVVSASTVQRWFMKFRESSEDLENKERGRPETVLDNDELRKAVEANPRATIRELAEELNVSKTTVSDHLKQIEKRKKLNKWVPYDFNNYQKLRRFEICFSLILRNKNNPFLNRLITCNEKWIIYDNRKRSEQWLDKDEAPKHFPKPKLSTKKIMVTVWWSAIGIIYYDFMKTGETIDSESYCQQIEKMHQKLSQKKPALVNRKRLILHHDNAKPHVSKRTVQKLRKLEYETLHHPVYSPDLSPTDYYFFKHLNNSLAKKVFKNDEEAKTAFEAFIEFRSPDFYVDEINKLVSRWQRYIDCCSSYYE